ncbi:alpha/beta-hydrolase [Saccharata proteae CBS 121410]|uniref:Alpha/beta-hydrolase n=1 Tax=Saccharata proteae CBS 121410 TaxID=1314787 RepID=A0A9P4HVN1_9PEZI|nr:alpha/beta-hydrolase [Saccharata proteae CBS 121410]
MSQHVDAETYHDLDAPSDQTTTTLTPNGAPIDGSDAKPAMQPEPKIVITRRTHRTIRTALLHMFLRPWAPILLTPRKEFPAGSPPLKPTKSAQAYCRINERKVNDIYVYDLESKKSTKITKRIYYIGGGSWRMPPSPQHWRFCAKLVNQLSNSETSTVVSIISPPLAPAEPAPTALPRLLALYETVMREAESAGERVIWAGDSSGGNIVLAIMGEVLRGEHQAQGKASEDGSTLDKLLLPTSLFLICPSVDACRTNPVIPSVAKKDPVLSPKASHQHALEWAGDWDPCDPRVSPLQAAVEDVALLSKAGVRVDGVTAGFDILSPDAVLLRGKMEGAGVQGEWLEWEKQMHCFPLAWFYGLPEAREALSWIVDRLKKV